MNYILTRPGKYYEEQREQFKEVLESHGSIMSLIYDFPLFFKLIGIILSQAQMLLKTYLAKSSTERDLKLALKQIHIYLPRVQISKNPKLVTYNLITLSKNCLYYIECLDYLKNELGFEITVSPTKEEMDKINSLAQLTRPEINLN